MWTELFGRPRPEKIICVGLNYRAHSAEQNVQAPERPLLFAKWPNTLIGADEPIVLPPITSQVDYECELGVVMAGPGEVWGYTCVNDVSARDLQFADGQWVRGKSLDTFCPVGPHIETQLDPTNALVETRVNGSLRQSGRTSLMAYPVAYLVRWISRVMTLFPGDLIATGTPAGVGPLVAGDNVEVSVSDVGVLRNPVQSAQT